MTSACLNLLGSPEFINGETRQKVRFAYAKLALLVAYLALEKRVHTRESLADLLWPELDVDRARANLRRALFNLQQAFVAAGMPKSLIHADRSAVSLSKECFFIDVLEFEKNANPHCIVTTNQHLGLYKGVFLDGICAAKSNLADWLQNRRMQYEQKNILLLERAVALTADADDFDAAERRCRQLITVDCTNELAHFHLIRLYMAAGKEIVARKIYRTYCDMLQLQFGVSPSRQLAALFDQT